MNSSRIRCVSMVLLSTLLFHESIAQKMPVDLPGVKASIGDFGGFKSLGDLPDVDAVERSIGELREITVKKSEDIEFVDIQKALQILGPLKNFSSLPTSKLKLISGTALEDLGSGLQDLRQVVSQAQDITTDVKKRLNDLINGRMQDLIDAAMKKIWLNVPHAATEDNMTGRWREPAGDLKYEQVTQLVTHNAFSSLKEQYVPYAQQKWNLTKQLDSGIRGLMLDTYVHDGEIYLCHGGYDETVNLLRPRVYLTDRLIKRKQPQPQLFRDAIQEIVSWMNAHPEAVVTVFLESYVPDERNTDRALIAGGAESLILKPVLSKNAEGKLKLSDKPASTQDAWNPEVQDGWPTLKWMRENNKRLVILNDGGWSEYTFRLWATTVENKVSTVDARKLNRERGQSSAYGPDHNRYLYLFNCFPDVLGDLTGLKKIKDDLKKNPFKTLIDFSRRLNTDINYVKINSHNLPVAVRRAQSTGIGDRAVFKDRNPNFLAIDFVNNGKAMEFANKLNAAAKNLADRAVLYRPALKTDYQK